MPRALPKQRIVRELPGKSASSKTIQKRQVEPKIVVINDKYCVIRKHRAYAECTYSYSAKQQAQIAERQAEQPVAEVPKTQAPEPEAHVPLAQTKPRPQADISQVVTALAIPDNLPESQVKSEINLRTKKVWN